MAKNKKSLTTMQIIVPIIGTIGTIIVGYLTYLGVVYQADASSGQPSPNEATIKFVVLDKTSNKSISGATINLQIDVMPSETNVTDTDGVARFFLKPELIGLHGFLRIEADGYKSQKRDMDIDEKKPYTIYLEPENLIATQDVATETPISLTGFTCSQAPKIRVQVGDKARVTPQGKELTRLRSKPEAGSNVIESLAPKTELEIIGGPVCYQRYGRNDAYVYWKVFVPSKSMEGWVAEGDFDHYYIEPLP